MRGVYASLDDYRNTRAHGTWTLELCRAHERRYGDIASLANLADVARETRNYGAARVGFEQVLRRSGRASRAGAKA